MTEITGLALHRHLTRINDRYIRKATRAQAIDRAVRITFDAPRAKAFMADYTTFGLTSTMCLWVGRLLEIQRNFRRIMEDHA